MPIYEYRCRGCGEHIEKRQTLSEGPLKTCEKCGGELEKQWSLSGFQFKGAGWYVTDYAKNSGGSKDTADKGEKSSASESTDTSAAASKPKSDTTPAPTKESGSKKE
jgi:putative FmdB family regulatory protein